MGVQRFGRRVKALDTTTTEASAGAMVFEFVEGLLVQAVREGHWVLLDEINLASAEVRM